LAHTVVTVRPFKRKRDVVKTTFPIRLRELINPSLRESSSVIVVYHFDEQVTIYEKLTCH